MLLAMVASWRVCRRRYRSNDAVLVEHYTMSFDTLMSVRKTLEGLGFEVCIDLEEYFYETPEEAKEE